MGLCPLLLAFKPLHLALQPHVAALLYTPPGQGGLALGSLLLAVWALGQLLKLPCCIGLQGGRHRPLGGLAGFGGQALGLALEDFVDHLRDGLLLVHESSLPTTALAR